jgi:hypothetical protein
MRRKLEAASRDKGTGVVAAVAVGFTVGFGFAFAFAVLGVLGRVTWLRGSVALFVLVAGTSIDDASFNLAAAAAAATEDTLGAPTEDPGGSFLFRRFCFCCFMAVLRILVFTVSVSVIALFSRHVAVGAVGGISTTTVAAAVARGWLASSKSVATDESSGVLATAGGGAAGAAVLCTGCCFFRLLFFFLVCSEVSSAAAEAESLDVNDGFGFGFGFGLD